MKVSTIDVIRKAVKSDNVVTRSVYKGIAAKRMQCSPEFIQITYLIGWRK